MDFPFSGIGLVMAGGKSRRMGRDKAFLQINGASLIKHQYELLSQFCPKVYVSCAANQGQLFDGYDLVVDQYEDIGPLGGLASILDIVDDTPVLVLAVDMPAITTEVIAELVSERDLKKNGTVTRNRQSQYLQPLFAIYEASARKHVLEQLTNQEFAMHKLLSAMQIHTVDMDESLLINVNSNDQIDQIEGLSY